MSTHDSNDKDTRQKLVDAQTLLMQAIPSSSPNLQTAEAIGNAPLIPRVTGEKGNRRLVIIAVVLVVLILGSAVAWSQLKKGPVSVTLYQANMQNVTRSIGGNGQLYAVQTLDISYPLVERVVAVNVKPGDDVSPNQALIQLDMTQLNAQVKQAADEVASSQSKLNKVAGTVQAPEAQREYEDAVARYNTLVAEAKSPTLNNGTLISPLKGHVVSVSVQPGEVAAANSTMMTLAVDSTLVAHIQIPLLNLGQVYVGQTATVTPSALPDQTFQGSVSTVIPQASANSDTFEVWINVNNDKNTLLANMNVFASVQEPLHTVVVPRLAVLNPDHGSTVFVVRNGKATLHHIQVGGYAGDKVIVSGGLSDGDLVVLTGLDTLKDGQDVNVISTERPKK
ncbi:efflux RND transporter periplasmic adaptor subunit [Tengunoibacter tsumagoiensis]|uniref:MexH family multidrug efflux RND transporter periplasmic adaptor subunit n=1 Tax=Tengunoibacter tsumagoiensis TaxID=2014871 RepID=A0A401ZVM9_9CHLR|nr:efflux RND transporter periplasmic adaptor subunit [Tengunoibacter tsumagoiensis]GCE10907.1 MexH family multidrug efflux RND transporter periplasmic adaptor subunit [Tengunoibacter tsumagoiensis]